MEITIDRNSHFLSPYFSTKETKVPPKIFISSSFFECVFCPIILIIQMISPEISSYLSRAMIARYP